jgi:hypothetical protein
MYIVERSKDQKQYGIVFYVIDASQCINVLYVKLNQTTLCVQSQKSARI